MNIFSLFKRTIIYNFRNKIPIDQDDSKGMSLDKLFNLYGSDKANEFKKNIPGHGFSQYYEKKFNEIKNKDIKILEVGSYAGASAAAFVKYFYKVKVFCFDINISNFSYKSKDIFVFGLDVNNEKKVTSTINNIFNMNKFKSFDIIIDDGSHLLSDIVKSFNFFFQYLNSGGYYIIEDFKHPNYYNYNNDIDHIFVDEIIENFRKKKTFRSSLISKERQLYLINTIKDIQTFKGNLSDSDICFIKKK